MSSNFDAIVLDALETVKRRAPDLGKIASHWAHRVMPGRLPAILSGMPPALVVGSGWIESRGKDIFVRKIAELAFREQHGLLNPPTEMGHISPQDRELWNLAASMLAHVALQSRFPAHPRDREIIEKVSELIGDPDGEEPGSLFESLRAHENEIDNLLDGF